MNFRIEYVPLSKVKRWPHNPRTHDEAKLDQSIDRFGFIAPLMLDEATGKIVAGHGRLEALLRRQQTDKPRPPGIEEKDGEWMVPVVRGVKFKDEAEAEAYLLADNRLNEKGGWDAKALAAMLTEVKDNREALSSIGFSRKDVAAVFQQLDERPPVGKSPAELREGFENAEEKQVVLYFDGAEYDVFVAKFEAIQKQLGTTPSETLERLLGA